MELEMSTHELELYERMQDAMISIVMQHVVSISAYYEGELRQHATGGLFRFADHHFLITAAHAIEQFDKGKDFYSDICLYIDNGDSNNLVPLYGEYHATQIVRDQERPRVCIRGERDDLWDIGLWELDRRTVDALTNKRFLNRQNISITSDLTIGVYFLAGCPCSWMKADSVKRQTRWKWLRYTSHPYPEWRDLPNFDERFHMALCLGDDPQLRELKGISGCPIWKLTDLPIREDWNVDQVKVVAVETCVYPDRALKAIRGTKWSYVLPILTGMHPEIRKAFKLWIP